MTCLTPDGENPRVNTARCLQMVSAVMSCLILALPLNGEPGASCKEPVPLSSELSGSMSPFLSTEESSAEAETGMVFFCSQKTSVPAFRVIWFSFTPEETDSYRFDTSGSQRLDGGGELDTVVGVFSGECPEMSPLANACNDNVPGSLSASVTVPLMGGTTYLIAVGTNGSINPLDGGVVPGPAGQIALSVRRVALAYPYEYLVPAAVKLPGSKSDLFLTNLDSADGVFKIQFLGHGNPGDETPPSSQPESRAMAIAGLGSKEFSDVLGMPGLFGLSDTFGSLLIRSTRRLSVGVLNQFPGAGAGSVGHFGQAVDVSTGLLTMLESGRITGVRDDGAFQTGIAVFNRSSSSCRTSLQLRNSAGAVFEGGESEVLLPPNTLVYRLLRDVFKVAVPVRSASLSVTLPRSENGCAIGAATIVSDVLSGDSYGVPLRK